MNDTLQQALNIVSQAFTRAPQTWGQFDPGSLYGQFNQSLQGATTSEDKMRKMADFMGNTGFLMHGGVQAVPNWSAGPVKAVVERSGKVLSVDPQLEHLNVTHGLPVEEYLKKTGALRAGRAADEVYLQWKKPLTKEQVRIARNLFLPNGGEIAFEGAKQQGLMPYKDIADGIRILRSLINK